LGHVHHNTPTVGGNASYALSNPAGLEVAAGPVAGWNTDGQSVDHTHTEGAHTHPLTGAANQAVAEGPSATVTALSIDDKDKTSALGGPWPGNEVIELDITSVFVKTSGTFHKIGLSLSGLGRVVSLLRIYYTT
jgi:hypothetical protein